VILFSLVWLVLFALFQSVRACCHGRERVM
jgi:hypothetical protein